MKLEKESFTGIRRLANLFSSTLIMSLWAGVICCCDQFLWADGCYGALPAKPCATSVARKNINQMSSQRRDTCKVCLKRPLRVTFVLDFVRFYLLKFAKFDPRTFKTCLGCGSQCHCLLVQVRSARPADCNKGKMGTVLTHADTKATQKIQKEK